MNFMNSEANKNLEVDENTIYHMYCHHCEITFPAMGKDVRIFGEVDEEDGSENLKLVATHPRCGKDGDRRMNRES